MHKLINNHLDKVYLKKKFFKNIRNIIFIFILTIYSQPSYAYIDPFTGGFIIQAIIAIFTTIMFYLGYPIRLIKKIYNKVFKKKKKDS